MINYNKTKIIKFKIFFNISYERGFESPEKRANELKKSRLVHNFLAILFLRT